MDLRDKIIIAVLFLTAAIQTIIIYYNLKNKK